MCIINLTSKLSVLLTALVLWLLPGSSAAQVPNQSQPVSHWQKMLSRQTDSTRKAEVLLFAAKDVEVTNPTLALDYAQRAFDMGETLKSPKLIGLASLQLSKLHTSLGNKGKARRFRKRAEENLRSVDLMAELNRLETQNAQAEAAFETERNVVVESQQQIVNLSSDANAKAKQLKQQGGQLTRQVQVIGQKDSLIGRKDQLIGQRDSVLTRRELEMRYQTDQIKILEQQKQLQIAETEQERTTRNALLAGMGLLLLLAGLLWRLIVNKQRANRQLAEKNNQLDLARRRSDELLLNILPEELVNELKEKGITQTRHHDEVTIMFTDFKDFTKISELLTPTELVKEIDYCFRHFDHIIGKYPSIEKIKTIGDAYLCVGGLPAANANHAAEVVAAALDIRDFINELQAQRTNEGKQGFQIRIGVHTGPVVAGVVGAKKFAYDIWGDTVNTAARLESSGEPGQVNISEVTHNRVQSAFVCRHRGQVAAKNKADMTMYFVDSAQPVLSLN